jgi:hypothetical protein
MGDAASPVSRHADAWRESSAPTGTTSRGHEQVSYRTYELTFSGQAGSTARAEFEDCEVIVGPQTTTLRAELPDQAALAGLIERLLALRCELVRVVLLPPHQQNGPVPEAGQATPASDGAAGLAAPAGAGEPVLTQFAFGMVNRLFSVGLSLTNAQGLIGPGAAADRLAAAIGELDDAIRDIRTMAFGHVTRG